MALVATQQKGRMGSEEEDWEIWEEDWEGALLESPILGTTAQPRGSKSALEGLQTLQTGDGLGEKIRAEESRRGPRRAEAMEN